MPGFSPLTSSGPAPSGPAGGDLSGTYPNPAVAAGLSTSKLGGFPNNGSKTLKGDGTWGDLDREAFLLSAQGLLAETFDRALGTGTVLTSTGALRGVLMPVPKGLVISNLVVGVQAAGSGMTHGWLALYDTAGVLLASSADSPASFQTTGFKTLAMTAAYTMPADGCLYASFLGTTGTSMPTLFSVNTAGSAFLDVIGTGKGRSVIQTGLAALPAPAVFVAGATTQTLWLGAT